jgi:hypothetical protein
MQIFRALSRVLPWALSRAARASGFLTVAMLAISYFVLITPLAMIFRCFGRDLLRLRRAPEARSAWKPGSSGTGDLNMLRPF